MISAGQNLPNYVNGVQQGGYSSPQQAWAEMIMNQQRDRDAEAQTAASARPSLESYAPAAGAAMMDSYNQYQKAAQDGGPELGNLAKDFEGGTADYNEYGWRNMNNVYDQYAPDAYEQQDFTFGDNYGPITNDAYQFQTPDIEGIQNISGVPGDVWDEISRGEEMSTRQGYEGQRGELARRLAAGGGGRGGMSAVMNAQLGSQEEGDVQRARRQAAIQRAMQEVGIAQGTQALTAQRGTAQAQLQSRTDEMQAQELARKQGLDIEDARYRVGLMKQKQEMGASEKKYGYESGTEQAKYRTGLEQAYDEAKAGESRAGQEWNYNRQQDLYNAKLTQHQQGQQDNAARQQAALSGAQLGQGMVSQAGSYDIQKNPDRNSNEYKGGSEGAWNRYEQPKMATTKNTTQPKTETVA